MKTISIPLNNRPQYSERMFESLRGNDLRDWDVFLFTEPFRTSSDRAYVNREIRALKALCKSVTLQINPIQFGVYLNSFVSQYVPFKAGSDLNLFIEDDVIVSRDITRMADWYGWYSGYPPSIEVVGMICHINTRIGQDENLDPMKKARPECICYQKGLGTFGLVFTKKNWETFGCKNFFNDLRGWDFSLSHHIRDTKHLRTVAPLFCRANHIGAIGTHCTPEHNEQYSDIVLYDGPPVTRFEMVHDLSKLKAIVVTYDAKTRRILDRTKRHA